jgi:hypothetical protein
MCGPDDHVRDQQSQRSVAHALNLEDEEGGDSLDPEGFSDVSLFLGFYLKSKEYIA